MNRHRVPASNTDNKLSDEVLGNIACSSMGSEYDANSNQTVQKTTLTTPTGVRTLITRTEYDANGRAIKVTDAEGNVTSEYWGK